MPDPLKESLLRIRDQLMPNTTEGNETLERRLSETKEVDLSAFIEFEIVRGAENSAQLD